MKNQKQSVLVNLRVLLYSCLIFFIISCQKKIDDFHNIHQYINLQKKQKLSIIQQKNVTKLLISVKDFGAIGNGISDDTNAIQRAIDTVYYLGGGSVFFPGGIYKVRINRNKSHAITIRAKVILKGYRSKESVIKLAPKQGNYSSILAGEKPDSDLSDFAMYDLAIDGNGSSNPVILKSDLDPKKMMSRHSIRIYIGSRINIERCRFINQNNSNVITINGNFAPYKVSVSDVSIMNNIFELIGGGKLDYDHSTIYSHGEHIKISNNYFASRNGAGTNGARTAIEIHGDQHTVKDNIIKGFTNGMNITGFASSSNRDIITNNLIEDVYSGITIWSHFSDGNTSKPALTNCIISNNKINLNINGWRHLWGNSASTGISLESTSDAPIKNLNIVNNIISFNNFKGRSPATDSLANGIRLWRNNAPNIESENIHILDNKIQRSLAGGIYIFMPLIRSEISRNTVINPGQSQGKFHKDYRAAILVDGSFDNIKLDNNLLIDNQKKTTLSAGIVSSATCKFNCEVKGNSLQVRGSKNLKLFRSTSNKDNALKISL
jgi:hypothetical protein